MVFQKAMHVTRHVSIHHRVRVWRLAVVPQVKRVHGHTKVPRHRLGKRAPVLLRAVEAVHHHECTGALRNRLVGRSRLLYIKGEPQRSTYSSSRRERPRSIAAHTRRNRPWITKSQTNHGSGEESTSTAPASLCTSQLDQIYLCLCLLVCCPTHTLRRWAQLGTSAESGVPGW